MQSIINGYSVPISPANVRFVRSTLLPLHRARTLFAFHKNPAMCVVLFLKKQTSAVRETVEYICEHVWPKVNTAKQVLLLGEIEDIIGV
jgi:serine/threonine-protein phosphatase 2A regulatory subunit B'